MSVTVNLVWRHKHTHTHTNFNQRALICLCSHYNRWDTNKQTNLAFIYDEIDENGVSDSDDDVDVADHRHRTFFSRRCPIHITTIGKENKNKKSWKPKIRLIETLHT